jgi:hypothetical protein
MRLGARPRHLSDPLTFRVKRFVFDLIVERKTINVVDKRFCRHVLGKQKRVIIEFVNKPISEIAIGYTARATGEISASLIGRSGQRSERIDYN